jgi:hypothetical protein
VHDKTADEARFLECIPLLERGSEDDRDYVRKAVDMALRALGKKRNPKLRAAALELAQRLSESGVRSQALIGRSALRELGNLAADGCFSLAIPGAKACRRRSRRARRPWRAARARCCGCWGRLRWWCAALARTL